MMNCGCLTVVPSDHNCVPTGPSDTAPISRIALPVYAAAYREAPRFGDCHYRFLQCCGCALIAERSLDDHRAGHGVAGLIFKTSIVLLHLAPHLEYTGKQWLVRELPKKRRRTEVSVPCSGSGGAIGWHNN